MKNCPYIEFGGLEGLGLGAGVKAVVYRRVDTASKFGLSERLLLEVAILCGNDFTSEHAHKDPPEFLDAPVLPPEDLNKSAISIISAVCEWMRTQDAGFEAEPARASELGIAIRYSRAFYELEDLSVYRVELEQYRKSVNYVSKKESMSANLSGTEKAAFASWMAARTGSESADVGISVLNYVSSKTASAKGRMVALNGSAVPIGEDHMSAFSRMLEVTARPSASYESDPIRASTKALPIPSWGDLMVAHAYQCLALRTVQEREAEHTLNAPEYQVIILNLQSRV
jgi:hypothetical protein